MEQEAERELMVALPSASMVWDTLKSQVAVFFVFPTFTLKLLVLELCWNKSFVFKSQMNPN